MFISGIHPRKGLGGQKKFIKDYHLPLINAAFWAFNCSESILCAICVDLAERPLSKGFQEKFCQLF